MQFSPVQCCTSERWTPVDLLFDERGDISGARSTTRARGDQVQPWQGHFSDYRDLGGIRLPTRGEVPWEAPEGDFIYWRGEIESIEWLPKPS